MSDIKPVLTIVISTKDHDQYDLVKTLEGYREISMKLLDLVDPHRTKRNVNATITVAGALVETEL
jgi:hypothetical protein